jgi:hypothetical protein
VDLTALAGQISLGAAAVVLFLTVGRSYINYIGRQLTDERAAHEREINRLTAVWEARITAEVKRGDAWETAAQQHREANIESSAQVRELTTVTKTTVALLEAIRQQGSR